MKGQITKKLKFIEGNVLNEIFDDEIVKLLGPKTKEEEEEEKGNEGKKKKKTKEPFKEKEKKIIREIMNVIYV